MTISTAISDAGLAAVTLGGAALLQTAALRRSSGAGTERIGAKALGYYLSIGGLGVGLVGLAALVGTLRFAGVEEVAPAHDVLSRMAGAAGVPMVGLAYAGFAFRLSTVTLTVVAAGLTLFAVAVDIRVLRTVLGALAMLGVLIACSRDLRIRMGPRVSGILGAVATLCAGLAIGTQGDLLGWPRIDWFHWSLAAANALLVAGLLAYEPRDE